MERVIIDSLRRSLLTHHLAALLIAGSVVTVLHVLGPDHWLPHVIVSKAQGWSMPRTLRVTLLAALSHVGLTIGLGVFITFLVVGTEIVSEGLTTTIMAIALVVLGLLFIIRHFVSGEHAHKAVMSDGAATLVLLMVAAFPPCYAILPLFLAIGTLGWGPSLVLALIFSLLTIGLMLTMVTLGRRGYSALDEKGILHSLEDRQNLIIGAVFLLLAVVIWLGL